MSSSPPRVARPAMPVRTARHGVARRVQQARASWQCTARFPALTGRLTATLATTLAAACLLAVAQALRLRRRNGDLDEHHLSESVRQMIEDLSRSFDLLEEDRPLEKDLRQVIRQIRSQHWKLY